MKRYTMWCNATHKHEMMESEQGSWVLYEDIKHLLDVQSQREWALVPADEPLGAYLTGLPGKMIYAIDERGVPLNALFRVWKMELPLLPEVSQRPQPDASDDYAKDWLGGISTDDTHR